MQVDGSVCVVYHLKFAGGWVCVCIICSVRVDVSVCVLSVVCGWMVLCVYYLWCAGGWFCVCIICGVRVDGSVGTYIHISAYCIVHCISVK